MFVKNQRLFIIVMVLVLLGISSGCGAIATTMVVLVGQALVSDTEDVTEMDSYQGVDVWESYGRNQVYRLKLDLVYGKIFITKFDEDELLLPRGGFFGWNPETGKPIAIPGSIEAYKSDLKRWAAIKGMIPAGTRLKTERVIYEQDINTHEYYYFAVFVDGPITGKGVLLNSISTPAASGASHINPDLLEKVNP
ncbi:hypothetical protein [Methyloglobulus sp.]|uniref:hypothetical protein n=1 Tax=Methyloglobulus sp. TaxID=2518622 RepID=UPI0032B8331A